MAQLSLRDFLSYALYLYMDVHENMAFGVRLMDLPKPDIADAAVMLKRAALLKRKPVFTRGVASAKPDDA